MTVLRFALRKRRPTNSMHVARKTTGGYLSSPGGTKAEISAGP